MVHALWRRRDARDQLRRTGRNWQSEIPCRVSVNLPLERAISLEYPANNGEALPCVSKRVIPWEVESNMLFDPVTTEAKAEMESAVVNDKSKNSIRRRPSRNELSWYIAGFVDGEGCFCVSIRPQERIRLGWEVRPSFSVSQNRDRAEVVRLLPEFFGCGFIRPDRSDRTLKYEVRSLRNLNIRIIQFFDKYQLQSAKKNDFELFRSICSMMIEGAHLYRDGFLSIVRLAEGMNASGIRKYSMEDIQHALEVKG
jgi:hypothetical protein